VLSHIRPRHLLHAAEVLPFRITERFDDWFWHPRLRNEGKIELSFHNKPFLVSFHRDQGAIPLTITLKAQAIAGNTKT
jgi:hypothetical protein